MYRYQWGEKAGIFYSIFLERRKLFIILLIRKEVCDGVWGYPDRFFFLILKKENVGLCVCVCGCVLG